MRKQKIIKIDDSEIKVSELRVKDIRGLIDQSGEIMDGGIEQIEKMLPLATDLTLSQIENMAPSELQVVWDAFREVNAVFFGLVAKTGILETLKNSISKDLTGLFVT